MIPGALVLAAPVLVAVLVWWWTARKKDRPGKSLPIFLLGYAIAFTLRGLADSARQWSRPQELGDYLLFVFLATLAGYFVGALGWLTLLVLSESGLSGWLDLEADGDKALSSGSERVVQQARQRAIEDCAEEAYEFTLEHEPTSAADYDRAKGTAARLRDAILGLGEKGEHGS
jgi:hypothetical protein